MLNRLYIMLNRLYPCCALFQFGARSSFDGTLPAIVLVIFVFCLVIGSAHSSFDGTLSKAIRLLVYYPCEVAPCGNYD